MMSKLDEIARQIAQGARRAPTPPGADLADARRFAEQLAEILNATPGAPRASVWQRPGVGTRVYLAGQAGAYLDVSRGGDVHATSGRRVSYTPSMVYPAQARAIALALGHYRERLSRAWEHDE